MQAVYINRPSNPDQKIEEPMVLYILCLIAEKFSYCCELSLFINIWQMQKVWNDKTIFNLYYNNIPPRAFFLEREKAEDIMNGVRNAKKHKHKNKDDLEVIHLGMKLINDMKEDLLSYFKSHLKRVHIYEMIDLLDEKIATILPYILPKDKEYYTNNELFQFLHEVIVDSEEIMFFHCFPEVFTKGNALNIEENKPVIDNSKQNFISLPLFKIPGCSDLSAANMKYIRSKMLPYIKPLSELIYELKEMAAGEVFGLELFRKVQEIYSKISIESQKIQDLIKNEIYFQQFINSKEKYIDFFLYAGVGSLDTLIYLFQRNKVIEDFSATALRKNIERQYDLQSCDAFLYWDIRDMEGNIIE